MRALCSPPLILFRPVPSPCSHDFLSVCKVTARETARQVVWMSGLPTEWGDPPSIDPPDNVVSRTQDYLDLLGNKILGYKAEEAVAKLLNGHAIAVLLKEFGDRFTKGGAGGGAGGGGGGAGAAADALGQAAIGAGNNQSNSEAEKMQTLRSLAVSNPCSLFTIHTQPILFQPKLNPVLSTIVCMLSFTCVNIVVCPMNSFPSLPARSCSSCPTQASRTTCLTSWRCSLQH